jgi:hypothetical protein
LDEKKGEVVREEKRLDVGRREQRECRGKRSIPRWEREKRGGKTEYGKKLRGK